MNMSLGQIIFLSIWIVLIFALPLKFANKDVRKGQMIATGMGILGTFLGITYGLWNFDTENIETAVPELLGGMKFAFLTSIVGMGFSLIIGMFSDQLGFQNEESAQQPQTDQGLLAEMLQILQETKEESKVQKEMRDALLDLVRHISEHDKSEEMVAEIKGLREDVVGEGEQSLISEVRASKNTINEKQDELINITSNLSKEDTQNNLLSEITGLREDIAGEGANSLSGRLESLENVIREKQDELKTAFDNFAEKMAQNNMDELSKAIQQVMKDFNTQINEKLGDSFNNLNSGVTNLLTWLEENRAQMDSNIKMLEESNTAITGSAEALNDANDAIGDITEKMDILTKNAESFDNIATELAEALGTMGNVMVGMNSLAETLAGNGDQITAELNNIMTTTLEEFGNNLVGIANQMALDYREVQRALSNINNQQ